ncbi:MAG: MBL fold metallo-hydrolase [Candidatus Abyssubacteria bacterium]
MQISDTVHLIRTPTPFSVGHVNCYLIEDEPLTLIDSGLKTEEAEKVLRAALAQLGYDFADIEQVIITHAHFDHYGLMGTIAAEGKPRVLAHPLEVHDLQNPIGYAPEGDERYDRVEQFLLKSGLPPRMLDSILFRHPILNQLRDPIQVTRTIDDGDIVTLGTMQLRVIHCPGHSAGMVNLLEISSGTLFSGDNILKHISPVPLLNFPRNPSEPRAHSLADYLVTLKRLKTLAVRVVLPGHGEIMDNLHDVIDGIMIHHEMRKDKVLEFLKDSPKTAFEVCLHLFPEVDPYQVYLGMSEAVGHLDLLECEGVVEARETDGATRYVAKGV